MIFLIVFCVFCVILYFYNTRTFDYWKKKGVKHDKPVLFFGTNTKGFLMMRSTSQLAEEMYWKYPEERVVGCFRSTTPELLLRDPELVKHVLLGDFEHFHDRGIFRTFEEANEPMAQHLFNVDGDLWRLLRQRLTPAFSSGKLKAMFPLIVDRAERLHARIYATEGTEIDARDLMARFTTDFIGACAFGLDMDALTEENSKFRKLGVKIFEISPLDAFKTLLKEVFPETFKQLKWVRKEVTEDVLSLVKTVLKQRNYEPSGRNDFIDILLECQKKGVMVGSSIEKYGSDGAPVQVSRELTEGLLAAQVFVFFAAGFETSSSTSSYTLHLLAYHPEKQKKLQEEIDRVLALHNNKLSYDAIRDMVYLECAFKESMRILPSVGFLARRCTRKYTFPDINLTIDKGVKIMIPVQAMQNDPKYFDNPNEFRPERFLPDQLSSEKSKYVYMPFGEGPRACIGERLGLMQSLAGLAAVLSRFSVEPAANTIRHPQIKTVPSVVQLIDSGLPLVFRRRENVHM